MKIVENKALLLNLRSPGRVENVIPKSKKLSEHEVLVNWGVDEVQVLRNMGINAPSPIEGRYEWTGRYDPYAHQKATASFFTLNKRSFCFKILILSFVSSNTSLTFLITLLLVLFATFFSTLF